MCGIIGIVGNAPVADRLVEALQRLEYRGYDSAGVATVHQNRLCRRRAEGKLAQLKARLKQEPLEGMTGIGHTRWATHGAPTKDNAHPHATDQVSVVHNGIIENFQELKAEFSAKGYKFLSETDSEVVPVIITDYLAQGYTPHDAVYASLQRLEGAFALGIAFTADENLLYAARRGSPLAIGHGEGENYLGSDALALATLSQRITYLEEGDFARITRESVTLYDSNGQHVTREIVSSQFGAVAAGKENYRHYMEKEIHEQPQVIADTLHAYQSYREDGQLLPNISLPFPHPSRITLVACGTSFYAAMVGKYWIEHYGRTSVETDIASEFRYREGFMPEGGVAIFISQSGETADTLAALRLAKQAGQFCIAIVNVEGSTMAREADMTLPTYAGPEIGVASTKAFTTQLTVLACLALEMGRKFGGLTDAATHDFMQKLMEAPSRISSILMDKSPYDALAHQLSKTRDVLYLGRGTSYPLALEGALKLKEISYIHAEGYASGEMKHGPIALIDEQVPIIVLAPQDHWQAKSFSNLQEAKARGGRIILITDKISAENYRDDAQVTLSLPSCDPFIAPLLYAIPVQLLAYYTAVHKGTDVDQPRNLAKSVTVE
jgi:glucosamine--fructose-6-phosphate aminotransferase (isomerizing)